MCPWRELGCTYVALAEQNVVSAGLQMEFLEVKQN